MDALTDKEIDTLVQAHQSLIQWMIGDAFKAFHSGGYIGAVVLGLCAIDTLGVHFAEKKKNEAIDRGVKETFTGFVRSKYMKAKYKTDLPEDIKMLGKNGNRIDAMPEALYSEMRCKLVHGYSAGDFLFVDHKPEEHLQKYGGVLTINVETFLEDIQEAGVRYFIDLCTKKGVFDNYIIQVSARGILQPSRSELPASAETVPGTGAPQSGGP